MRITKTEKGRVYGRYYTKSYKRTYTQPISRFVIAWLYHNVWEKYTWKSWRALENAQKKYLPPIGLWIPHTNRQDIRCDHLRRLSQIEIHVEYESPEPSFGPRQIDMLHTALGTFLQDYPDFWADRALAEANNLHNALAIFVYGEESDRQSRLDDEKE